MSNTAFDSYKPTIYSVPINAAVGTSVLVAAKTGVTGGPGTGLSGVPPQAIAPVGWLLTTTGGAATITLTDATASAPLTGPINISSGGYIFIPINNAADPLGATSPGDALSAIVTGEAVTGYLQYILLPENITP